MLTVKNRIRNISSLNGLILINLINKKGGFMDVKIDRFANNIENKLTNAAYYPVLGIVPGVVKAALGVIQAICSLAYGILMIAPAAYKKDWTPLERSWEHIKHGLGNISSGLLEAIPGVGFLSVLVRDYRKHPIISGDVLAKLKTMHEDKFMPYTSLEYRDFQFVKGTDPDHDAEVEGSYKNLVGRFDKKIEAAGGEANLSPKRKYELALEASNEYHNH